MNIVNFLLSLPKILSMIKDIFKMWNDLQRKSWEHKGDKLAEKIQEATTDEERKKLAKELAQHTSKRP